MARLIAALLLALLASMAWAADAPPNLILVSPTLTTSGQPSAAWLATLKARAFWTEANAGFNGWLTSIHAHAA